LTTREADWTAFHGGKDGVIRDQWAPTWKKIGAAKKKMIGAIKKEEDDRGDQEEGQPMEQKGPRTCVAPTNQCANFP